MRTLINVGLLNGPTLEGYYVFKMKGYPYYQFECEYDGTDVSLDIISDFSGTSSLYDKLVILHELLKGNSNFKKELFKQFPFEKNKVLNNILYEYMDYIFVINKNSDIDELIREYYRTQYFIVLDTDTEEDILNRNKKLFKLLYFIRKASNESFNVSDLYLKYKDTFCFDENESIEIERNIKSNLEERFESYLYQYGFNEEFTEEIK